jgi:hypothetical protein
MALNWPLMPPPRWPGETRDRRFETNRITTIELKTQAIHGDRLKRNWLRLHDCLVLPWRMDIRLFVTQDTDVRRSISFPREEDQISRTTRFVMQRDSVTVPELIGVSGWPFDSVLSDKGRHDQPSAG